MCREQILHLWSITTLTGETKPSFLFYFISMLAKFSLNLTRCWALMKHFMKYKNYRKFFGCKIEGMHSGWVVWYSVVKNITVFNNLPCHGKYACYRLTRTSKLLKTMQSSISCMWNLSVMSRRFAWISFAEATTFSRFFQRALAGRAWFF